MTTEVTADEVREAMVANQIESVDHHDCAICGYMTQYVREGDVVVFDAGCGCTGEYRYRPSSFQDIADHINLQDDPRARAAILRACGIPSTVE